MSQVGGEKIDAILVNLSQDIRLAYASRKTFPGSWPEPFRVNQCVSRLLFFAVAFRNALPGERAFKVVFREKDRWI